MRAFTSKDRTPATRHYFTHTSALPPPYQLAIEDAGFRMTVLENHVPRDYDCDRALAAPTWFSVTVMAPPEKRYLYLVQHETETGLVVLLMMFDRSAAADDGRGLRLPASGAWLRALVDGPVIVLASDLVLPRKSITAFLGGTEPPTSPAMPPYT
ncbi:MAG TPA: hypothetical protein VGD80_16600 [Kofleriaceae bacterium]